MTDVTRLIVIEGSPGSGKSTTAQWLARQWQVAGRPCRWIYEQQPDHPVVGIPTGADYDTWEEYFAYRRDRWSALAAEAVTGYTLTIMESAVKVLDLETLIVDPHDVDWLQRRAAIARFLGLSPRPDESPSTTELMFYVGHYHVAWKGDIPPVPARSPGRSAGLTECIVSL